MNISLTPELEEFVAKQVENGAYPTASEVVGEGLRLLRERDDLHRQKKEELQKVLGVGIEQANQGKLGPLNAQETLAAVRKKRAAQAQENR